MNAKQAKGLPLPDIMAKLGYYPKKVKNGGKEYWYLSPFRKEQKASFHTSYLGGKWIWNDFGDRGGTVLDFIMRHENTDVSGALAFLDNFYSKIDFDRTQNIKNEIDQSIPSEEKLFVLDNILPLRSPILENYLKGRAINLSIARLYLKVIQFHHVDTGTKYFGLGIKNLKGDYEVRNPKLKTVVGTKDISFIEGDEEDGRTVAVFEGLMDFLSFLTDEGKNRLKTNVILLNSSKMANRAKLFISEKGYQKIYTFFDNDRVGEETTKSFSELPVEVVSCNHRYQGFNDYNEFLMQKKA